MIYNNEHRYNQNFVDPPGDQGGSRRHRCACCALELGYDDCLNRSEKLDIDLDTLPVSKTGDLRHNSPHEVYALGYLDEVKSSYKNKVKL